jgi:uncharacterized protein
MINTSNIDPRLTEIASSQPYPLLFMTISGAHLYGFPSPDSDYDLRGVHILPVSDVIGLNEPQETLQDSRVVNGLELDYVTHDAKKFFTMLLKKNGYVMEQLFSPLIVSAMPEHAELKHIAQGCLTRHHSHHYFGFADHQWDLFEKEQPRRVKPLLYVYRILLTGINLMRTDQIEANLLTLNDSFKLFYIDDLVARKLAGPEHRHLANADIEFYRGEYHRLRRDLEAAHEASTLPENPTTRDALNDLLVRLRLPQEQKINDG